MSRNQVFTGAAMAPQAAAKKKAPSVQMMKDEKYGSAAEVMALPPAKLVSLLQDAHASVYAKAKACQRLAVIGDKSAVPALAPLLTDPALSHYARTALEPMPDRAADGALRGALAKAQGKVLVGIIGSIGKRRDAEAMVALEKLRHGDDGDVTRAASSALVRIRQPL
jgi:HEAT repeat protein